MRIIMTLNKIFVTYSFILTSINAMSPEGNNEAQHTHDWCYSGDCGPSSNAWDGECQTGHRQSPIDISTQISAKHIHKNVKVQFSKSYAKSQKFRLKNNGHTIQLSLKKKSTKLYITLDDFKEKYVFEQMHFHWGSKDSSGSEHTIDKKAYSMEAHFVHYSEKYADIGEAVASNDKHALIVVGVFMNAGTGRSNLHSILTPIAQHIPNYGKAKTLKVPIALVEFFDVSSTVYRYEGSLTTPPCSEIVLWHVFTTVITVGRSDVEKFRKTIDANGNYLKKNFRPVQNKRTIDEIGGNSEENQINDFNDNNNNNYRQKKLKVHKYLI